MSSLPKATRAPTSSPSSRVPAIVQDMGGSRPLANEASPWSAPLHALEGDVNGDVDGPHRERDLPPCERRSGPRDPSAPRYMPGGRAPRRRPTPSPPSGPTRRGPSRQGDARAPSLEPRRRLHRAHERRAARVRKGAKQTWDASRAGPYMTGLKCRQPTAEHLCGDAASGATRVREQGGEVGLRRCRAIDLEPIGKADRDQDGVRSVSNGKAIPRSVARQSPVITSGRGCAPAAPLGGHRVTTRA